MVDREYRYDWDQAAISIVGADIEGHSNWWAWFLGVLVVDGISVGWWRMKLRTKTSDSIEEQIGDLNEESSTQRQPSKSNNQKRMSNISIIKRPLLLLRLN